MSARTDLSIVPGFKADRQAFLWRGIGHVQDLDIDFGAGDRAGLVTQVLATCAEPAVDPSDLEEIWQLSLAARVGGLLAVYAATTRVDDLPLTMQCPHEDCSEPLEVALPVTELLDLAQAAEQNNETQVALGDGDSVRLRRPCGTDQRLWRKATFDEVEAAKMAILDSLVVAGSLTPEHQPVVADALASFDPLSCFDLDVACPACERRSDIPVDLESVLLSSLARAQTGMIRDVDQLARRYGWSEADVLNVPAWRRRRYLAMGDDGWPA